MRYLMKVRSNGSNLAYLYVVGYQGQRFYPRNLMLYRGPFKYYVIKEVGGWGQKMAIFDDLQYCKSSKRWVGGPKKVKNVMT